MRIEIYNDEPAEKVLRVRLRQDDFGFVTLLAVDAAGASLGKLLNISKTGRICRYHSVNPSLGLDLDERGRIKLTEE